MGKIIAPETSPKKGKYVNFDEEEAKPKPDSATHLRNLKRAELRKIFVSIDSQFAESNVLFRNYKYHDAHLVYPNTVDVDQRFVSKCYPYAKGGLLLVDEPRNEREKIKAYEKQRKLQGLGYRHVVLEDGMDVYDLAKQLRET